MGRLVFSIGPRANVSPARHTESTYAFLERCGKPGCDAIRRALQHWFDRYPKPRQEALLRRLKADDFASAFYELYLHEVLRRLRLHPQVEPALAGRRPDFICQSQKGQFALEACVVTGESREEAGRRVVLNVVYDAINQVKSPDYFFDVEECDVKGVEQPSLSAIVSFLKDQIERVEYERIVLLRQEQGIDALPRWIFDDDRIRLVVRPIPKQSARGQPGVRAIGIYPVEGGWVTTKHLRAAG